MDQAVQFVDAYSHKWHLDQNPKLETTNHVLRIWIQSGGVAERIGHFDALCAAQHADGGWGDYANNPISGMRTSAFACQMLMRAHMILPRTRFSPYIKLGLNYITAMQREDGGWTDDRWPRLDATSVSVGTLLFATNGSFKNSSCFNALHRGMDFILAARQTNGMWYHKPKGSPVEITAHLLQKCCTFGSPADVVLPAMQGLLVAQHADGYWNACDIDATCDVVRCLMLAMTTESGHELYRETSAAVERGMSWLVGTSNNGAVGRVPGGRPSVLYTSDLIDTVLKYLWYRRENQSLLAWYR